VAPEGGLCGRFSGKRRGGGDGLLFGHVDSEERVAGDPGVGGSSARQVADRVLEA
jgi:hypothetical protein